MKRVLLLFVLLPVLGFSGICHATLIDRGGGLIYDTVWDITWLQDANLAGTLEYENSLSKSGLMQWNDAVAWTENLTYQGYSDWRLPTSFKKDGSAPCSGNCADSEMLHLFLTGAGISLLDPGPFINLQPYYWSGTEYFYNPDLAYSYATFPGWAVTIKNTYLYAWAVRDGDSVPVPEPTTLSLAGIGIAVMFLWLYRTKSFQKTRKTSSPASSRCSRPTPGRTSGM